MEGDFLCRFVNDRPTGFMQLADKGFHIRGEDQQHPSIHEGKVQLHRGDQHGGAQLAAGNVRQHWLALVHVNQDDLVVAQVHMDAGNLAAFADVGAHPEIRRAGSCFSARA